MTGTAAWLALLRGINVGGHHKVPMAELRDLVGGLGLTEVRPLIASGNVVFRGPDRVEAELADELAAAIEDRFGFPVPVVLRQRDELEATAADNPFPDAEPKLVHVHFLAEPLPVDLVEGLDLEDLAPEAAVVRGREIVVHYANGSARSTIGPALTRRLGGHDLGTARNWNTVGKLVDLLAST